MGVVTGGYRARWTAGHNVLESIRQVHAGNFYFSPDIAGILLNSFGNGVVMLLLFLAVCLGIGGFGSLFTASSVRDWYPLIQKPAWTPPSWLFGPVWTMLYIMMAFAAWLVWRRRGLLDIKPALALFAVQLILNAAWSPLFFGLKNPLAGLLDIVALWAAILATLISFWKISPAAASLLVPYWLWVSFATILNFSIWRLNR
jgi:tryptophan-rich sensory protein